LIKEGKTGDFMITISSEIVLLVLLAVFLGTVLTLVGVALGALAVFRTKREPHERLFRAGMEKGDAFVMDNLEDGFPDQRRFNRTGSEQKPAPDDAAPGIIARQTERFLTQLKANQKGMAE
jgi:hypothetical protein